MQLRMGQAALQHGAVASAQQTCLQLIEQEYKPVWRLCRHVMRQSKQGDGSVETQMRLLTYAIQYAPPGKVSTFCLICPLFLLPLLPVCSLPFCFFFWFLLPGLLLLLVVQTSGPAKIAPLRMFQLAV